jgi:hypothetical protein
LAKLRNLFFLDEPQRHRVHRVRGIIERKEKRGKRREEREEKRERRVDDEFAHTSDYGAEFCCD